MNLKESIFTQDIKPWLQGSLVMAFILFFLLVGIVGRGMGIEFEDTYAWLVVCSMLLFFALFNSVLSLSAKDRNAYWFQSLVVYVCLAGLGALLAWWYSGLSMNEAGAIKWLYFVISFGWLLFMSIVRAMKKVVNIAIRQDKRLRGEE